MNEQDKNNNKSLSIQILQEKNDILRFCRLLFVMKHILTIIMSTFFMPIMVGNWVNANMFILFCPKCLAIG